MLPQDREIQQLEQEFPFPKAQIERAKGRKRILTRARQGGIGAEIGVFRGHFSVHLIETLQPTKIYLIDPWTKIGEYFKYAAPYTSGGKLPTRVALREAQLRTAHFRGIEIRFVEGYFLDEIGKIEEKLDWIYFDASHQYLDTLRELQEASKIIKEDGVIIGDDWYPNPSAVHHGVFRAVQEFTRAGDFQIIAAGVAAQYCLRRAPKYG